MSFMQFYQKSLVEFDNRRVAIYTERKVLQERLDHVTKALSLLSTGSNAGDEVHEVNILLNTASAGPVFLFPFLKSLFLLLFLAQKSDKNYATAGAGAAVRCDGCLVACGL
jgi:hypothetical protein